MILKKISQVADSSNDIKYFEIVDQCMKGLDEGVDNDMVEAWFWLNLVKTMGEEVNLYRDCKGEKLEASKSYNWDVSQSAFYENEHGEYGADEIKVMRIMTTNELNVVKRVKTNENFMRKILDFVKIATRV